MDTPLLATGDLDILWDTRSRLSLIAYDKSASGGLIDILKQADRSFETTGRHAFRAVNRKGFMVDLIKAMPKHLIAREPTRLGSTGDLRAVEIRNLHWILSAPKFIQTVIGEDGRPATMIAPDPRAFVLHKLWLSEQEDREPIKKQRDHTQAIAVAQLISRYMPQYAFRMPDLRMFPRQVIDQVKDNLEFI